MAAAVVVWCGLLAGGSVGLVAAIGCGGLAVVFAWLALRAPARTGTVALLLAVFCAALARGAGHTLLVARARGAIGEDDRPWRIVARAVEPPTRASGEPEAVVAVDASDPPLLPGTRLRMRLPPGDLTEWGDRIEVLARLEPLRARRNPGGMDARAAGSANAIAGAGRAYTCRALPPAFAPAWPRISVARWRRAIEAVFVARLSARANQLVIPLVIGDRSALPPDLGAAFRAAGLVHLLALSGLHVVWLAALARGLCALAGGGVRARAMAGALCALGYAGIAGPLPSLLRAAATELLVAAARWRGRALDPLQALALGAIALLIVAPGWCADLGFQLSCAATLGLVTIGPPILERAGRARTLVAPLVPTLAAQVPATPLLIARFHALSWTGGIANLVAVPIAGLLLAAAWIGALCDLALPGLGGLWFQACEVLAAAFRAIADLAGARPGAMPATGAEPLVPVLAGLGAALLAIALPGPRTLDARGARIAPARQGAMLLGAIACAVALAIAASVRPLAPPPGRFWLVALDVGQGDAIALGLPDGWWLVDAGPRSPRDDAGERVVVPFLRWAGVRTLETLVLTHDDGDHVGGVEAVRRALGVKALLASPPFPGVPGPGPRFGARAVARGDTLCRDPLVTVLWPPAHGVPRGLTSGDNAAGVVLCVGAGEGRALLMADVDSTVEESLAVEPHVAIVKLGHHGSASSSGAGFLARASPGTGLLSVGRHNPFGHPSPAVIARLARAHIPVARTDRSGALWFELSPDGARILDWRAEAPATSAPTARLTPSRPPFP